MGVPPFSEWRKPYWQVKGGAFAGPWDQRPIRQAAEPAEQNVFELLTGVGAFRSAMFSKLISLDINSFIMFFKGKLIKTQQKMYYELSNFC